MFLAGLRKIPMRPLLERVPGPVTFEVWGSGFGFRLCFLRVLGRRRGGLEFRNRHETLAWLAYFRWRLVRMGQEIVSSAFLPPTNTAKRYTR